MAGKCNRTESEGKLWVLIIVAAFCIAVPGTSPAQDAQHLYSEKCANCHAADGSGHTAAAAKMKIADLRSKRVKDKTDEELYTATAEGKSHEDYPHAFLHIGLTEPQIRDLIKYIRTFGSNPK